MPTLAQEINQAVSDYLAANPDEIGKPYGTFNAESPSNLVTTEALTRYHREMVLYHIEVMRDAIVSGVAAILEKRGITGDEAGGLAHAR